MKEGLNREFTVLVMKNIIVVDCPKILFNQNVARLVSEKYGIEFKSRTKEDENSNGMEVIGDDKKDDDGEQKTKESEHICTSCLGILQEQCDETVVKQVSW